MSPDAVYKLSADLSQAGQWGCGSAQSPHPPPHPGTVGGPHSHKVGGLASSQILPTRFNTSEGSQLTSPGVFLNPGLGQPLCYIPVGQLG